MLALARSWLCANCDHIVGRADYCTVCGSIALVHLEKLLNREAVGEHSVEQLIEEAYRKGNR